MKKTMYIFMLMLILAPYMNVAIKASEIIEKEVLVTADDYYEPQIDNYESGEINNKNLEPIYDLEAKAELDEETNAIKYEAIISHKAGTYANLEEANIQIDGMKEEEISNIKISYIVDGKEEEANSNNINIEDKYRVTTSTNQNVDELDLEFTTPVTEEMGNETPEVEFTFNYKGDKEYFVTDKTNIIELDQEETTNKESQNIEEPKGIDPKLTTQMDKGDITNSVIQTSSEYATYLDTQYNYNGFSIGYEVPDNDSKATFDGTPIGDDKTGTDGLMDDENGFGSKVDHHGILDFTASPGEKITLSIPYKFTESLSTALGDDNVGKISMWIDFDQDGTFSEDEYAESIITDESHFEEVDTDEEKSGNAYEFYAKTILEFTIPSDVKVGSTKLHTVLTTEQDSVTAADGNITTYPGYGEIEDYQADFYAPEDCTTTPYLNNNAMFAESVDQLSPTEVVYKNIENPEGANFNIDMTVTNSNITTLTANSVDTTTGKYYVAPRISIHPTSDDLESSILTINITETSTGKSFHVPIDFMITDLDDSKEWWVLNSGYTPELINQEDSMLTINSSNEVRAKDDDYDYTTVEGSFTSTNVESVGASTLISTYFSSEIRSSEIFFGYANKYSEMSCPNTTVKKEVINETGEVSGVAEDNEDITYKLTVTNDTMYDAEDVLIRDSLLENLPSYITYDGNVVVNPSDVAYSGSLSDGTFILDTVPANSSVEIEYTIHTENIPDDVATLANIVTDNGDDPDVCEGIITFREGNDDCDEIELPTAPNTRITKAITNETGEVSGVAEDNEDITYTLTVTNDTMYDAVDVPVRDSMLESLPSYVTYDGNVVVNPSYIKYTGSLEDGTFEVDRIPSESEITIEYTVHIDEIPDDVATVGNIVTDDGNDPDVCDPNNEDCDEVEIPTEPDTNITKEITKETGEISGVAEDNEDVTYTLTVTNGTVYDAVNVPVRDSMLESLPNYVTYDGNVVVNPSDVVYSGSLEDGTFVLDTVPASSSVEIEYTVHIGEIPDDVATVGNIVTDDGNDPDVCDPNNEDCDEIVIPTEPDTNITKEITKETGEISGVAEDNEDVTYTLTVTNEDAIDAVDVPVRDSMLESLPSYVTYDGNVVVNPSDVVYSGSLEDGTFVLETVPANSSVEIEYTVHIGEIPDDVATVGNIVTDDGNDPDVCDPNNEDCDEVEIPTEPDTKITKEITKETGEISGVAEDNEDITYTLTVTNDTIYDAVNVSVRDSMLENLPNYITYDGNVVVNPNNITYTGSLSDGTFVLETVPANSSVEIEYTVHIGEIPEDVETVGNIVTDDGNDPDVCDPDNEDCDEVEIPTEPDTNITKEITKETGEVSGVAEDNEDITYTLTVTNEDAIDAVDVPVRDSMLESLPSYVTYDGNVVVNPNNITYTGDLRDGTFVLETVPASSSVEIEYTVHIGEIPEDVATVGNIVTDDGNDPDVCDPDNEDCDEVEIPTEPDTKITKEITKETGEVSGVAEDNEDVTYTLTVTNEDAIDAVDVPVRDSMLESLPSYITYDGNVVVNPSDVVYSGSLEDGTFVLDTVPANSSVEIEYTVHIGEIPDDVATVGNIVTDDGNDPDVCDPDNEDCDEVEIPTEPDTKITKEITKETGEVSGVAEDNEDITYTLTVTNDTIYDAVNVPVRDSMLENLPNYVTYDGNVVVNPNNITYTGSLEDGTFVLETVPASSSVEIEYTVHIGEIPDDVETVGNIVTDDGNDPDVCDPDNEDCDEVEIPTEPDTNITKEITKETGEVSGVAEDNEDIMYTLTVTNGTIYDAEDVPVRDSMLESLPSYVTYDGNVVVNPSDVAYSGSLSDGTFILDTVPANSSVEIEYTVHIGEIPDDVETVGNIVTDDGNDPDVCDPNNEDCDEVEIPTEPDTKITKEITNETGEVSGVAEDNEDITYTLTVTNGTIYDAVDVPVRDSMLESLPSYVTYDGNVVVNPNNITYTGSLEDGTFVLETVPASSSVEIEYTVHIGEIPDDVATVGNIVTDDGNDPDVCDPNNEDCDEIEIPTEPDTKITKEITKETGQVSGVAEDNEDITYTLTVTNGTIYDAVNVPVRDSMLENLPEYIEYDGNVVVNPNNITYTGSLSDETFVLDTVPASSSVEIEYTVHIGEIPEDVETVGNIVTDDGNDPDVCDPDNEDCDEIELPTEPDTKITKEITKETGEVSGVAEDNEDVTYTLTVTNDTIYDAVDVAVRDSMLENLPEYIEYDGNVVVNPNNITYTGDLRDGTFVLDTVEANSSVEIEYTVSIGMITEDIETVGNIVTDNGEDPETCLSKDVEKDCDEVNIPTQIKDTKIESFVNTAKNHLSIIVLLISMLLMFSIYTRRNILGK